MTCIFLISEISIKDLEYDFKPSKRVEGDSKKCIESCFESCGMVSREERALLKAKGRIKEKGRIVVHV
jgi:hypothetical protein